MIEKRAEKYVRWVAALVRGGNLKLIPAHRESEAIAVAEFFKQFEGKDEDR